MKTMTKAIIALLISTFYSTTITMAYANYIDNKDGTITDTDTGLVWEQRLSAADTTWEAALDWCLKQRTGGHTDRRLPNMRELLWLVDAGRNCPALDPVFMNADHYFWSSTPNTWELTEAWILNACQGRSDSTKTHWTSNVRCVRAGYREVIAPNSATILLLSQ